LPENCGESTSAAPTKQRTDSERFTHGVYTIDIHALAIPRDRRQLDNPAFPETAETTREDFPETPEIGSNVQVKTLYNAAGVPFEHLANAYRLDIKQLCKNILS
jgi:hypothetical protein